MKFISVEIFFLIWALPVLFLICFSGTRKRQNILLRFSSLKGLKSIVPESSSTRRWIKAGLILLAILFTIVALSGPQYGYKWQKIERKGIDIIIALDCSKSMLAKDIKPDRLERAKREVYDLLSMLHGDRVALVAFAGTSFLQCPLTLDYAVFNLFLDVLSPDFLPVGGTDIYGAVITSLSGFNKDDNSEKAVILITDGQSTGIDPIEAAKAAAKADVKIFCIGIGSDAGVPVPDKKGGFKKDKKGNIVLTKLDENTLKKMTAITGGAYVRSVAGDMDLDVLYLQEIRGKMKASALESDKKQVWENRYQWPLALAIIALIAELFLPSRKNSRKKMIQLAVFMVIFVHVPFSFASGIHDSMKQGLEAYDNKNYEKALKFFIDAQLEDPDRPEILYNIGNTYYKMGDADSAYNHYKQIVKTKNKNLLQKTYYNLGNANFKRGELKDAVSDYKSALDINPDDTQARENMEFAKKVMEKQKKQQEQKKSQNQESDKKPGEKSGENQGQKQEKQQDGSNDKTDADENNGKSGQNNNMPDTAGNKENKDETSKGTAKPDDKTGDNGDDEQADRMLNRLTDRPGRAMIPAYRERRVEKDW